MSKYIRVRGQLYQVVDEVNGKMLNYLMTQLKPVLGSLSGNGYVLSQKPTAKGVDIILHREGSATDVADARYALKRARIAIYDIRQKVQKIAALPFFKDRFGYSLNVATVAEVSGRGPWPIMHIEANQEATMSGVLSKHHEVATPRSQRPQNEDYKDDKALQALRYLPDYLGARHMIDEIDRIQEYAKALGRLEPQLARNLSNFCKNSLNQSRRLAAEIKKAYEKHKGDFLI